METDNEMDTFEVYIGLEEFEHYFKSDIEILKEYAEKHKRFVQLVLTEEIANIPDFSKLESDYVFSPLWIGNVDFGSSDKEFIRSRIHDYLNSFMLEPIKI